MNRITPSLAVDAYSFDRYGAENWARCTRALLKMGFSLENVESIVRSKWTRWAADEGGKPYGKATAKDLIAFVSKQSNAHFAMIGIRRTV